MSVTLVTEVTVFACGTSLFVPQLKSGLSCTLGLESVTPVTSVTVLGL
ncbi:MAG: hypothetical protein M1490_04875 [Candidatus Bathyarchaeota archaeon]|nr:hypothetical protein [Candidatus Bathyarchaeota archaeon]